MVASIDYAIKDAFEGAAINSDAEELLFSLGNKLHINTREGTVRRRLLFREGDTVTADLLRETEKNLRQEQFLADAILEAKRQGDSSVLIRVTTYDQWTTNLAVGLTKKQDEWVWWFGPVESNLLGTGQRLGFFLAHDLERDSRWLDYNHNAFTPLKLRLSSQYAWLSDGYSYLFGLNRPLLSRTDRWGMSLSLSGVESAENLYLSGNDLDRLDREGRLSDRQRGRLGGTNLLGQWRSISTHKAYAGLTRSYGYAWKFSATPFYERKDRYLADRGFIVVDTAMWDSLGLRRVTAPIPNLRRDEVLGFSLSLYRYAHKTVHNFRNLKWSENLETGWRLTSAMGRNQEWLGADDEDWFLSHAAVFNNAWWNALFLNSSASLRYFLSPEGDFDEGSATAFLETQWKPVLSTSSVISGQFDQLFGSGLRRLQLGEESGLIGFPNFYYSGRARALFLAEQRYFPPLEFGTFVPALAVFLSAGNTYADPGSVDLGDLHYALGLGLRLGATRSVQKVINHINVVWPLGEKNLDSWSWGIRATQSL